LQPTITAMSASDHWSVTRNFGLHYLFDYYSRKSPADSAMQTVTSDSWNTRMIARRDRDHEW
jgi:hypothetical protein